MAAYYRLKDVSQLKDIGFRLSEGMQVLSAETIAPVHEATKLLEDAHAQARDIIQDAETVRENERQRGFEEGLQQGLVQSVALMLKQNAELDRRMEALEHDLMNIVMVSMRKLVDGFDDGAKAEAVVRGALKQMRREKKAEIRVAPEQLSYFKKTVKRLLADFPGYDLIEIVEDATLSAPHVVVETSIGRIEGDIGSRLADFDSIIQGIIPSAPVHEDDLITLDEPEDTHQISEIDKEEPTNTRKKRATKRKVQSEEDPDVVAAAPLEDAALDEPLDLDFTDFDDDGHDEEEEDED